MNDLARAVRAAKVAGAIILKHYENPTVSIKNVKDLVTTADIAAEEAIRKQIERAPAYGFLGEETGSVPGKSVWIVDPIDGTRPFSFGTGYFSVSIALASPQEILLGVVYNPVTKELFTAQRGKGATRNGKRLQHINSEKSIKNALVGCAFQYEREELHRLSDLVGMCLVNFSGALDVCHVASGRIDAAVYGLTSCIDHAAAGLIAKESGLMITNYGLPSWDPYELGVIAANPMIHEQIARILSKPLQATSAAETGYKKQVPKFIF
ncbi:MAG: hypothetical protein HY832_04210 [Candidatus Aenigmarchaeota archaeon]|nr:hypothetical protein [Candidatus Aenigmarchaeota archaeon]